MKNVNEMNLDELYSYIGNVYDVSVELIKKAGYWKYYKALGYDYDTATTAFEVAQTIYSDRNAKYPSDAVLACVESLWNESGMEMAGMDEDEWDESGDAPLWENPDWEWDEESEEWNPVE